MKSVTFTDFRKGASGFITQVEHGERLLLLRRGKSVAEIIPFTDDIHQKPSWKQPGTRLQMHCGDLSCAILEEREADHGRSRSS